MRSLTVLCDSVGDAGGAERYWETVVPALLARGTQVRILARTVSDAARFGAVAREVPWADEDGPPSTGAARMVANELRHDPPDAVITASVFDRGVLDAVRAAGPRWFARIHDHRTFCPTGDRVFPQFSAPCSAPMGAACRMSTFLRGCVAGPRPSSFRRIAAREQVRNRIARADGVLVSSEHMRATCATNGIDAALVAITPPPLPEAAFASAPAPRPAARILLFASRLTPRKGLRSLIAALALMAPHERPQLVIAGEGDSEERDARDDALRLGVDVVCRGKLSAAELRAAMDETCAVVVPSLWPEPFGLVGIEAQARGRPAVAYGVGGIGDWIEGAGISVKYGDEEALAAAIRRILEDRVWSELAAAARLRAEAYRLEAHVDRLLQLLEGDRS
jgi:glycosyltransferase involved in cell wall biosynthesis